jgi:hypothetical protein
MWRTALAIIIVAALILGLSLAAQPSIGGEKPAKLRVGTYDSRAIAIAYGNSDLCIVNEKRKQYQKAKEAGDEKLIKELEEWGPKYQRQLHRQGFGRVPVTDLLEFVKDRLPEAAEKAGVDVIAFECNYFGPGVEEVDITVDLVMLFNPSKKGLAWIEDLKEVEPLDLDEIEKHQDDM